MILAFFLIITSLYVLIKYITLIHNTNNKVISLFGMIKAVDIKGLAQKCEDFSDKYLESKASKNDNITTLKGTSFVEKESKASSKVVKTKNEDQSYLQIQDHTEIHDTKLDVSNYIDENLKQNLDRSFDDPKNQNNNNLAKPLPPGTATIISNLLLAPPNPNVNLKKKDDTKSQSKPAAQELKSILKKEKEEEGKMNEKEGENNLDEIRKRKLMNSVNNNQMIILVQYFFILSIFITYFSVDYALVVNFLKDVRQCYSHLELIAERPSLLKYRIVFSNEEIATSAEAIQQKDIFDKTSPLIDVRKDYRDRTYSNEIEIFNSLKASYPASFSKYQNSFQILNYDDVCKNYYQSNVPTNYESIEL